MPRPPQRPGALPAPAQALAERSRQRAAAELGDLAPREWYRIGDVRAEVVGDAGEGEGEEVGEAATTSTADVYLYGSIGGWSGVTADDFVRDVAALDVERIVLHVNSPGGDCWDGLAMGNVLRAHRADVLVRVDGIAASAASVVAMAGDEVVMGIGSQMMVHDAWTFAMGNAADLAATGVMLDSISDSIAATYAAKAGGTSVSWRETMRAEAWYTAEEAVAAGLADRVATTEDNGTASGEQVVPGASSTDWWDAWDSLGAADRHDLSVFAHAGRAAAPAPPMPARGSSPTPPAASASGSTTPATGGCTVQLDDEQVAQVRTQLGLPENADEATVTAALMTRIAQPPAAAGTDLPESVTVIDSTVLANLQAAAQRGDAARAQQEADEINHRVSAAIADGRIAPANRQAYIDQLTPVGDGAVARSTAALLDRLPKGAVPVDQIGYTGDYRATGEPVENSAEDTRSSAAYKGWKN